jgi:hypothetical protein
VRGPEKIGESHALPAKQRQLTLESADAIISFRPEYQRQRISPRPVIVVGVREDLMIPFDEVERIYARLYQNNSASRFGIAGSQPGGSYAQITSGTCGQRESRNCHTSADASWSWAQRQVSWPRSGRSATAVQLPLVPTGAPWPWRSSPSSAAASSRVISSTISPGMGALPRGRKTEPHPHPSPAQSTIVSDVNIR